MTTCRWCRNRGHNIRSCKERKEWCVANKDSPDLMDRSNARHYIEVYDMKKSNVRRCKFCKAEGHDLRTCSDFSEIVDNKVDTLWEARKEIMNRFDDFNFGIGSLVSCEVNSHRDGYLSKKYDVVGVVTDIRWPNITDMDMSDAINWQHQRPVAIQPMDESRSYYVRLPREIIEVPYEDCEGRWRQKSDYYAVLDKVRIVSPSKSPIIPAPFTHPKELEKISRNWAKSYYF